MRDDKGPAMHKCPLCEGRGELSENDLTERLSEKDLGRKLASYVGNVVVADENAKATGKTDFQRHVDAWNCTHFLWRRSPKE